MGAPHLDSEMWDSAHLCSLAPCFSAIMSSSGTALAAPIHRAQARFPMCRNIKMLFNFDPPATPDEMRDASLQFVRKISGCNKPSKANEAAYLPKPSTKSPPPPSVFSASFRPRRRRATAKPKPQEPAPAASHALEIDFATLVLLSASPSRIRLRFSLNPEPD